MWWRRATFKGKQVWVECDAWGAPLEREGRRLVRYSDRPGATVYPAFARGIEDAGGEPRELDEGTAPPPMAERGAPARPPGERPLAPGAAVPATGARPAPAASGRSSGFGSAGTRTASQAAAAKVAASAKVASSSSAIRCFTDGGCQGNPGPAGSGLLVKFPDGRVVEQSRALGIGTNNIAELTAIDMALDVLAAGEIDPAAEVVVFSDSQYARGVLTLGWKAKANVELIAGIRAKLRSRPGVRMEWVAGHVGLPENERADRLAAQGVEASKRR